VRSCLNGLPGWERELPFGSFLESLKCRFRPSCLHLVKKFYPARIIVEMQTLLLCLLSCQVGEEVTQGCCKVGNTKKLSWVWRDVRNHPSSHERTPTKMTTIPQRLSFPNQALLFELKQLYRCLQTVPDRRKRRGWPYPLAALLMIGVLAKLAGWVSLRAISHWAKLRQQELSCL